LFIILPQLVPIKSAEAGSDTERVYVMNTSPPVEGRMRKLSSKGNWGGLLNRKQKVKECDATKA
jgi:hypothetical protein